jgi:hypothetical protein
MAAPAKASKPIAPARSHEILCEVTTHPCKKAAFPPFGRRHRFAESYQPGAMPRQLG